MHNLRYCWGLLLVVLMACQSTETRVGAGNETTAETTELRRMIGQMMMVGTRGMRVDEIEEVYLRQLREGKIGGIVLFDYDVIKGEAHRNIQSPEQVRQLIADLQRAAPTKLFVALDQEGGRVNRLKTTYGFPASVSNQYLGTLNDVDSTRFYAERAARTISELGFNVNFAPAVDVNLYPENPVIGKIERSYSPDPQEVIKHGRIQVEAQNAAGILSTLKHFPGHGSSHSDSHYGVTDVTKYWKELELEPFRTLGSLDDAQVAVMTAHVVNQNLDPDYPATLSKKIIDGILRQQLGFDGIVFSDDMHMRAVHTQFGLDTMLTRAVNAGVDVLVFGNNLEYDLEIPTKAADILVKAVKAGTLPRARIEEAYRRIVAAKERL